MSFKSALLVLWLFGSICRAEVSTSKSLVYSKQENHAHVIALARGFLRERQWLLDEVMIDSQTLSSMLDHSEFEIPAVSAFALIGWLHEIRDRMDEQTNTFKRLKIPAQYAHRYSHYLAAAKKWEAYRERRTITVAAGLGAAADFMLAKNVWTLQPLLFRSDAYEFAFVSANDKPQLQLRLDREVHTVTFESWYVARIYQKVLRRLLLSSTIEITGDSASIWRFQGRNLRILEIIEAVVNENPGRLFRRATPEHEVVSKVLMRVIEIEFCVERLSRPG